MNRVSLVLLLAAACAPQNAEITSGSYIAFLADDNSLTLAKERIDPTDFGTAYNVDCRDFASDEEEAALRLDNPLDICGGAKWPPEYEEWGIQSGYHVFTEPLEPWRGEALITGEGDLQIAFHQHIQGQDLRVIMTVDPDFGPVSCENTSDGFIHVRKDRGDWVSEWSTELADLEGQADQLGAAVDVLDGLWDGKLFFLNSLGYQLNPESTDQFWSLPTYWSAGAAQGKFSEEPFQHRVARYAEPWVYNLLDLTTSTTVPATAQDMFYCDLNEGDDPTTSACMTSMDEHIHDVAKGMRRELNLMMTLDGQEEPVYDMIPIAHTNFWRPVDGRPPGFDGWGEIHYNYVVFSKDSDLTAGGHASGAFVLVFDAVESSSRFFVKGTFEIPRIKKDKWVTPNLELEKLQENGVELCDAPSWTDANLPSDPGLGG
ncbi:MAG: hypothetical protein H6735_13800 [Alphaproteobacteria bacterium]|nr:hypothetical protein [Alphaproteobacteria bacterium]